MKRTKIVDIFAPEHIGSEVCVKGWVRTRRGNKNVQFVALNDGSTVRNLQVVFDLTKFSDEQLKPVTTGSSICVIGKLVESMGKGQTCEVQADSLEIYGTADPNEYPLQKKGHTLEFLREKAHLRPRTATFGAILRIRSALAFAIHKFFQEKGFFYLHTPLITGSDCEGAGAMFQVTTLPLDKLPKTDDGSIDYSKDFFGKPTALTVSGQLEGELGATALGAIYTFGPTFRAENSNTPRHLAEFWMIEPEMAFYDITDNMDLAEEFVKYCIGYALDNCRDDINFLMEHFDAKLVERLEFVLHNDFVRLPYTEGIEILKASGKKFEFPVEWGVDLQSEHERFLVEEHFKRPVILTDYPKEIKAFYMKQNDDGRHGADVRPPAARLLQRLLRQRGNDLHMLPGGDLRHHAAVEGVHIRLGGDDVGEDLPPVLHHRRGGLVAGGLKGQDLHKRPSSPASAEAAEKSRVMMMASSLGCS